MSATTYITRKEELSHTENSRLVQETEVWVQDGLDFSLKAIHLIDGDTKGLADLNDIVEFATINDFTELKSVLTKEMERDNLDSTDYEVCITY